MIRLLLRLLRIHDYEICLSCKTLKEQLSYERSEKAKLTETLLNILQPKVIESSPVELSPIQQSAGTFARRRAALEAKDREEAKILREAKHLGVEDNIKEINNLESELGIEKEG